MINYKVSLAIIALVTGFFIVGCNTIEGVGEDIEKAGEAVQRQAK